MELRPLFPFPLLEVIAAIENETQSSDKSLMSPLAERYYRSCQFEASETRLESFLSQHHELNAFQLAEVLLVDQILEWQHGAGPCVEQYLQRFPMLSIQRHVVLELVCGEMRAGRALGLPVEVDAYVARFPDLAEPLRRQGEVAAWLAKEPESTTPMDRRTNGVDFSNPTGERGT